MSTSFNVNKRFGCHGGRSLVLLCGALLAAATALFYCFYANEVWEDYFITFKFSQNLCEGKGLVYHAGERVHGFTSPLGVLLPALCHWMAGGKGYEPALWLFRLLFCVPAFVLGGLLLMRTVSSAAPGSLAPVILLGALYAFECKSVAFSVNGMETALMLMFLAWTLYLLARGKGVVRSWLWVGVAWAGLMWTRPDSCFYVAASAVVALAFGTERKTALLCLVKAALVTTALYLPWLVWAWVYYGSPVPHTITAKGADMLIGGLPQRLLKAFGNSICAAISCYNPPYWGMKSFNPVISAASVVCGSLGMVYWLLPFRDRLGRMASLMFFLLCVYLAFIPLAFPWYYPPAAAMGLVAVVRGVFLVCGRLRKVSSAFISLPVYLMILLLALYLASFGQFSWQSRTHQREIESGNRRKVGEWLKAHVQPGERVYLECLGYIGYFSEARMLDWPGLCTPAVIKARKANPKLNYFSMVDHLKPEWVVVRFYEWCGMIREPNFRKDYGLAAVFLADSPLYDGLFLVLGRLDAVRPFPQVDLDKFFQENLGYSLRELFSE